MAVLRVAPTPPPSQRRRRTTHTSLRQHRLTRVGVLERDHPFTWSRCVLSLLSYGLLLSDVIRTGPGVRRLEGYYVGLEPDVYFGQFGYPVEHITRAPDNSNDNADDSTAYWIYKQDTTSIAMRALAQHLRLSAWSPCVTSRAPCEDESAGLPRQEVLEMLDTLIAGVARVRELALRAQHHWFDRLYHYALPWFFTRSRYRTIKATHYTHARLTDPAHRLCGGDRRQPFACAESWANFARTCHPDNSAYDLCKDVHRTIWIDTTERYRALRTLYANHTIELLLVEATEDSPPPSLIYHGHRFGDIVSLFRVQTCNGTTRACETIAVDDFRYEVETLTTSVADWFGLVATIRIFGQVYAWARLALLFAGCYVARSADRESRRAGLPARLLVTIKTVLMIPSQVVIYGSVFPIACYVIAHLLDSAVVYELVAAEFTSIFGLFQLDAVTILNACAVSMRTVWIVAMACHVVLVLATSRSWSPIQGVPGIREFTISAIASLTVLAQIRTIAGRDTTVVAVDEVAPSVPRSRLRALSLDPTRGFVSQLLFGTSVDPQCLWSSFLGLGAVVLALWLLHAAFPRHIRGYLRLFSPTVVPYGAGSLWFVNALVVTWPRALAQPGGGGGGGGGVRDLLSVKAVVTSRVVHVRTSPAPVAIAVAVAPHARHLGPVEDTLGTSPAIIHPRRWAVTKADAFGQLGRYMLDMTHSPPEVESLIYLLNLAVMTDPVTFVRLRFLGGRLLGIYESRSTRRTFLLPYGLATSELDLPINWSDLELLLVVNSKELRWWDLLHCS